jgi:hypothetical protein
VLCCSAQQTGMRSILISVFESIPGQLVRSSSCWFWWCKSSMYRMKSSLGGTLRWLQNAR